MRCVHRFCWINFLSVDEMMNKDDIIRMAREAGIGLVEGASLVYFHMSDLERFAALVAAAEREACAKTVLDWLHGEWHNQGVVAAMMIRERGQE
jgi:hypothetical protein